MARAVASSLGWRRSAPLAVAVALLLFGSVQLSLTPHTAPAWTLAPPPG